MSGICIISRYLFGKNDTQHKIEQRGGLICVYDVAGLMTVLELFHSIRYHHTVHKQRYYPFTCVLPNQGVSVLYRCQVRSLCDYDVIVFDVTIKL